MGQKGHSIFVLKLNRVLIFFFSFFVFIIKSKNKFEVPISIFNKNWKMNFCSFFHEIFFCAEALLRSVTSPKLPFKKWIFSFIFNFSKNRTWNSNFNFCLNEFRILNSNLIFKFLFPFSEITFFFHGQKGVYRMKIPSLNHFVESEFSHKTRNGRNAKFMNIIIHVNFHAVIHFH